jgi:DNA-binding NarL/FixJ family response regulator
MYGRIKRHGIEKAIDLNWKPLPRNQNYGTEHHEDDIIRLYKEGRTFQEIIDELGCAISTIYRFLKKNNIHTRKSKCRSAQVFEDRKEEIMKLVSEGYSWAEITDKTGLKNSSLRYHHSNWMKATKETNNGS